MNTYVVRAAGLQGPRDLSVRIWGRVLALDETEALAMAYKFWGRRKYTVKKVVRSK